MLAGIFVSQGTSFHSDNRETRDRSGTHIMYALWYLLTLLCTTAFTLEHNGQRLHSRQKARPQQDTVNKAVVAKNGVMLQAFEWYMTKDRQHWNRLQGQLSKLSGLGVNHLWIPPATKAGFQGSVGYDVYDWWDLGEFNQKGSIATSYGTKAELQALSKNATTYGIGVLADAVMNQRSGADITLQCQAHRLDPNNRFNRISGDQTIAAWVGFQFPGRGTRYSNKTYTCADFTAVDYDNLSGTNAVWKLSGSNNDFASDVSQENGNYDFLILADLAYRNPSVQEDAKAWAKWYIQEIGLSGFRIDAAKHISAAFQLDLVNRINSPSTLYIAEYLTGDVSIVQRYSQSLQNKVSVFDTTLQIRLHDFSTGARQDLRTVFDSTWTTTNPAKSVPYVNNHDTQPGQAIESLNISGWFLPLAYALILLRDTPSYPTVFWGDLYGQRNSAGQFNPPQHGATVANLMLARRLYSYGPQISYFDAANSIGWVRQGDSARARPDGLAVLLNNAQGTSSSIRMNVGSQHRGEVWTSVLKAADQVTIDANGWGVFSVGAGTVNVYARSGAPGRELFGRWDNSFG